MGNIKKFTRDPALKLANQDSKRTMSNMLIIYRIKRESRRNIEQSPDSWNLKNIEQKFQKL